MIPTMKTDNSQPPAYMNGLNDAQRAAVETLHGPVLVLAGAGTGKTRALTARLAHLLQTGTASPGQILAVTFTNKAAAEMKHRVAGLLGGVSVDGWWMGTFHSLAARMLRRHAEHVGLTSNFTIIDDDDQARLLKQIFELNGIDAKTVNPRLVLGFIDDWKNKGLRPGDIAVSAGSVSVAGPLTEERIVQLYDAYQNRLGELNACDFGDLLLHMVTLFKNTENGILAQYHARLKYILVDEYQDTNVVQYQFLRLLSQVGHNICCVGDDDQSIYAWRGAVVANILGFENDFPGATVVRLEQNYRSTQNILDTANGLIAHNTGRLGKNLWTNGDAGEPVRVRVTLDQNDEARQIADDIEQTQRRGASLDQMAVLVRTSSQMRAFEEKFNTYGIRYRVVGGPRFYERAEIRDALAYFRLAFQNADDLAFGRIINLPKRGLGPKTIDDIQSGARANRTSMLRVLSDPVFIASMKPSARGTLTQFAADMARWGGLVESLPPHELGALILEEAGYLPMWRADKSLEAAGRIENLRELLNAMAQFDSFAAFLEHVSLVMDAQENRDEPSVTLMTLHAAKGLEFDFVFLPGWEEGLFPSQRSMDENGLAGLEEERRLAYVGMTRARKSAVISYTLRRMLYGTYADAVPSRFIDELPSHAVADERQAIKKQWGHVASSVRPASLWSTPAASGGAFPVGTRVLHDKFGPGRVVAVDDDKLDVAFDKAGHKKVIDRFVTKL
jgi:DNA helicase-2/ATP-dependent DNA helicase PcrA